MAADSPRLGLKADGPNKWPELLKKEEEKEKKEPTDKKDDEGDENRGKSQMYKCTDAFCTTEAECPCKKNKFGCGKECLCNMRQSPLCQNSFRTPAPLPNNLSEEEWPFLPVSTAVGMIGAIFPQPKLPGRKRSRGGGWLTSEEPWQTLSDAPADVYSSVVVRVEQKRVVREPQTDTEGAELRALAVELRATMPQAIPRKVLKQTVMTTVYGVTHLGAIQKIRRQLRAMGITVELLDSFSAEMASVQAKWELTAQRNFLDPSFIDLLKVKKAVVPFSSAVKFTEDSYRTEAALLNGSLTYLMNSTSSNFLDLKSVRKYLLSPDSLIAKSSKFDGTSQCPLRAMLLGLPVVQPYVDSTLYLAPIPQDYNHCQQQPMHVDYNLCKFFGKDFCPNFWMENWDKWRDEGRLPAKFDR